MSCLFLAKSFLRRPAGTIGNQSGKRYQSCTGKLSVDRVSSGCFGYIFLYEKNYNQIVSHNVVEVYEFIISRRID